MSTLELNGLSQPPRKPHSLNEPPSNVPFLHSASSEFLLELSAITTTETYVEGQTIIEQGHHGNCMYFLSAGTVEVLVNNKRVATIDAGGFFGEMALLNHEKRNATIRTMQPTTVARIERDAFFRLCATHREFAEYIQRTVVQRSRSKLSL